MRRRLAALLVFGALFAAVSFGEQRFPPPDFESGYTQPPLTFQEHTTGPRQYLDIVAMIVGLGLAAWLLHYQRSRAGLFILGIASLLYFGFYKQGCVCPIGAIQNVALGLADPTYLVSLPVIAFFVLPLIFALIWGRVFCGAVCPLGAIQDLFLFKPLRVPLWLERPLGLLRYVYLGLAVFFAVVYSRFVICEYDPFVSFFRMYGPFWRLALGGLFLLIGLYIARPYCRYLCPYGALLSMLSRWTSIGVRTTPKECISCTLCDASCPFEAIQRPVPSTKASPPIRKFLAPGALVVLLAFTAGGYFATGGTISGSLLGAWFGVVIGTSLLSLAREGKRETYEVDQAACLSCGRCYESCPHEREKWGIEGQHEPIG